MNRGAMSRAFVALLSCVACARLEGEDPALDASLVDLPRVTGVQPPEGDADPKTAFRVAFSAAMDQGQLVASTGRSESVAIVTGSAVDRAAAAIEHSRLTVEERGLLVAAAATIEDEGTALTVTPDAPLAPGTYYLLVAARLRDPAGHRLAEALRYRYSVPAPRAQIALVAPPPGGTAPANLARARVSIASGQGNLALLGPKGVVASIAIGAPGPLELPLCRPSAKTCAPLEPGQTYSLTLDGKGIEGTSFTVARCARLLPPQGTFRLGARDTSLVADVQLDWPSRVALRASCIDGKCPEGFAETACAPDPCAPSSAGACTASVRLTGLAPATEYAVHLDLDDDEGHATVGESQRVTTLSPLPTVVIAEVMASPPGPLPRSDGEYVELWNPGRAPADVAGLTLTGPDGTARRLLGPAPAEPVALAPGARALAVGASFDASRYPLAAGTLVLRASTQRLLGRGLSDTSPPPFVLSSEAGIELSSFPGSSATCPAGASIELQGASEWKCGRVGGSPGAPP
jgi:hypothetical protein